MPTAARMTPEEYLEFEKRSDTRHEYVDGLLHAMAGETREHNRIVQNILLALTPSVAARACEIVIETVKLRTRKSRYRYPDVIVSCAPGGDRYFLENPCLLVEVLSESASLTDTTEKLDEYLRIPSLQRYVLVEQIARRVIVYRRSAEGWMVEVLDGSGVIEVPCLESRLSLEQVYAGLSFEEPRS
jgi:Uma2 family endonuclease